MKTGLKKTKGFTLIELLVVVAIISLLSSIVMASLNGARVKARDTVRISNLEQIKNALELYYSTNNSYPGIGRWATSEPTSYDAGTSWASLQTALLPYIKLPNDPKPAGTSGPWTTGNYHYAYASDGQIYDLVAQFEDTNNKNRCEIRQWKYHLGEGANPPETVWCPTFGAQYLYADH